MRRPTRRLALSLLGVLWLAALLLFFGARRKLEAAEPEGRTAEVRKGRRGRGCSGGTRARCRRRSGKKFLVVFGTPTPSRSPSSLLADLCLCGGALGLSQYHPGLVSPLLSLRSLSDSGSPSQPPLPRFTGAAAVGTAPAAGPAANSEHPRLPLLPGERGDRCAPRERNAWFVSRVGVRRLLSPVGHTVLPRCALKEQHSMMSGLKPEGSRLGWSVFGVRGLGEPG